MEITWKQGQKVPFDEDHEHEFKASQRTPDPMKHIMEIFQKYVNAFLNSSGGTIYFGVNDDGTIAGIKMTRSQRDKLRLRLDAILANFRPQVDADLVNIEFKIVEQTKGFVNETYKQIRVQSSATTLQEEKEDEEKGEEESEYCVVQCTVRRGRAPIYFTNEKGANAKAFMRRSGSTTEMSAEVIEDRKMFGRPSSCVIADKFQDEEFFGRGKELHQIDDFISTADGTGPILISITGVPFVGKSSFARSIAKKYKSKYPDFLYYIDTRGLTEDEVIRSLYLMMYPGNSASIPLNEVYALYSTGLSNKRGIVIADNGISVNLITKIVPFSAGGSLFIITSRKDLLLESLTTIPCISMQLYSLREDDAAKFLLYLTKKFNVKGMTIELAFRLCKIVGNLPAPIRFLAGILRRIPNTPENFAKELEESTEKVNKIFAPLFGVKEHDISIPDNLKKPLVSLAVFKSSFDAYAASAILNMDYDSTCDLLGVLTNQAVIEYNPMTERYFLNDLLRVHYLQTKDPEHKKIVDDSYNRLLHYIEKTLRNLLKRIGTQSKSIIFQQINILFTEVSTRVVARGLDQAWANVVEGLRYAAEQNKEELGKRIVTQLLEVFYLIRSSEKKHWEKDIDFYARRFSVTISTTESPRENNGEKLSTE